MLECVNIKIFKVFSRKKKFLVIQWLKVEGNEFYIKANCQGSHSSEKTFVINGYYAVAGKVLQHQKGLVT